MFSLFSVLCHFVLLASVLTGLFSSSWYYLWLMLEVNAFSFLFLLFGVHSYSLFLEGGLKYFLVQSFASVMIFFFFFFEQQVEGAGFWGFLHSFMVLLFLILKLGVFPLHHWFPYVTLLLGWFPIFFLFTVQSVLSFWIMLFCSSYSMVLFLFVVSLLFSVFSQGSQGNLRVFLSFSTMAQSSWLAICGLHSIFVFVFYYVAYSFLLFGLTFFFLLRDKRNLVLVVGSLVFFFLVGSLSGLPPFLGFFLKWMVLDLLILGFSYFVFFVFGFISVFSFYYYMRFFYHYVLSWEGGNYSMSNENMQIFFLMNFFGVFVFLLVLL